MKTSLLLTASYLLVVISLCFITSAHAQVPSGPLLWLRADSNVIRSGNTVIAWNDVSGHGNNATAVSPANRPRILDSASGNLPALSFDGVSQWMVCPNIFPIHKDYSLIVVLRDRSFANAQNIVSGSSGHALIVLNDSLPALFQTGVFATGVVPMATSHWSVLDNTFTTSTKTGNIRLDGLDAGAGVALTDNSDNTLEIGAFGGSYSFFGEISEVLVYDRALTKLERQQLDLYLASKYAIRLANPLPQQHGPIVWLEGDRGVTPAVDSVTTWKDLSGNHNDATVLTKAEAPVYKKNDVNGHAALTFSGSSILFCPSIFPVYTDYTKVVVFKCTNLAATNNLVSGTTTHALLLAGTTTPLLFHGGTFMQSTIGVQAQSWYIVNASFFSAQGRGRMTVNGKYAGSGVTNIQNADSTLEIGGFAGGNNFVGDIAEVLIYNRALTPTENDSIERALSVKYGITLLSDRPQFAFSHFPSKLQFYPRDADDSAVVEISGSVTTPGFDSVRVDQYRDGGYWKSVSTKLTYDAARASFDLLPKIYAKPVEFGFRVNLVRAGRDSLIGSRDSIICGDAYLVTGQSNSTPGNTAMTYSNEFCRTLGTQNNLIPYDVADTGWGLSSATGGFAGPLHVGVWALDLQRRILEGKSIPTCFITGGVGGTTIEQNMRNESNPTDLSTIYGRTLYRSRAAGVDKRYRAQFWYQGESNTILNYDSNFHVLHKNWRSDYPSEKKIYLIQIRPGCGSYPSHGLLREFERTVGDSLPDIQPFSPDGIQGHDGCHYSLAGYTQFAGQLYRLLSRDIYASDDSLEVESPNLAYAAYSNKAHSEITLVFRKKDVVVWPAPLFNGTDSLRLENSILLDSVSGGIASGIARNNHVILTLKAPSSAKLITYIPPVYYPGTATIYEGPWITNRRGVGAFTFNDVRILDSLPPEQGVSAAHALASSIRISSIETNNQNRTTVNIQLDRSSLVQIELIDALGRTLYHGAQAVSAGAATVQLATSKISSGVYFCKVSTERGEDQRKFTLIR